MRGGRHTHTDTHRHTHSHPRKPKSCRRLSSSHLESSSTDLLKPWIAQGVICEHFYVCQHFYVYLSDLYTHTHPPTRYAHTRYLYEQVFEMRFTIHAYINVTCGRERKRGGRGREQRERERETTPSKDPGIAVEHGDHPLKSIAGFFF